jgi:hypothetical protein
MLGASMTSEQTEAVLGLPDWVPEGAKHYIAHTEQGAPIRALARAAGCHASTVLRQIRKVEMRRDDPLVDAALRKLSAGEAVCTRMHLKRKETLPMMHAAVAAVPDQQTLKREAPRVLRRLCETGAVLAVAAEMEKAVVVRDTPEGGSARTAVVDSHLAQAMALKDWIAPLNTGRVVRYQITNAGRAALGEMAEALHKGRDALAKSADVTEEWHESADALAETPRRQRMRYALSESPLVALSRRRDHDGKPFLKDALVHAGERLREDFELAQMESRTTQNWDNFLTAGANRGTGGGTDSAPAAARARVAAALSHLGPGLSDVALRCCYLEGLETTEKRLGWSAVGQDRAAHRIAAFEPPLRGNNRSGGGDDRLIPTNREIYDLPKAAHHCVWAVFF